MQQIPVSVIVPTYQGEKKIGKFLDSMAAQSFKNFELIIVIDGSTDNTKQVIYNHQYSLNLKIIEQENKGKSASRNHGASVANGDLLIFFDDDMRPSADCIEKHRQFHLHHTNAILGGSQIGDPKVMKTAIQKFKLYCEQKWTAAFPKKEAIKLTSKNIYVSSANCSIPAPVFHRINGFDLNMKDAVDRDLAIRAMESGIDLFYDHTVFAYHDDMITCKSYIKRQREYQLAKNTIRNNKPALYKKYLEPHMSSSVKWYKQPLFWFFSHRFWVRAVDHFNIFAILPSNIQFKIYTLIVWGLASYYPKRKI